MFLSGKKISNFLILEDINPTPKKNSKIKNSNGNRFYSSYLLMTFESK